MSRRASVRMKDEIRELDRRVGLPFVSHSSEEMERLEEAIGLLGDVHEAATDPGVRRRLAGTGLSWSVVMSRVEAFLRKERERERDNAA